VFTNGWHGLHKDGLGFILTASPDLSSPKIQGFCPSSEFGRRGRSRFSAASDIAGHREAHQYVQSAGRRSTPWPYKPESADGRMRRKLAITGRFGTITPARRMFDRWYAKQRKAAVR
jgi:hypothetical protein